MQLNTIIRMRQQLRLVRITHHTTCQMHILKQDNYCKRKFYNNRGLYIYEVCDNYFIPRGKDYTQYSISEIYSILLPTFSLALVFTFE
jgi:hypothetical protein